MAQMTVQQVFDALAKVKDKSVPFFVAIEDIAYTSSLDLEVRKTKQSVGIVGYYDQDEDEGC